MSQGLQNAEAEFQAEEESKQKLISEIIAMSSDGLSVELSSYRDQHFKGTRYEQEKLLKQTATLYVGNLGLYFAKQN